MARQNDTLYNRQFLFFFSYNFFMALNFSSNAIYPLYVKSMGGTAQTVGAFMGVASLSAVVARPLVGWLIDRFGGRKVLIIGSLAMSLPSLGYLALLDQGLSPLVWLLRIVHGFGFGAHFSAFFASAAQSAPKNRRNEAIAMYGFSGLCAHLIGPFLSETIHDHYGLSTFFLVVTGFGLVALMIMLFLARQPKPEPNGSLPLFSGTLQLLMKRELRFVYLLAFLLSVLYSTPPTFLAPLARERGVFHFGLYFTGYGMMGMFIRLLGKRWGDRLGLRRVLAPSFVVYSLAMLTLFFARSTEMVMLAGGFSGLAHGIAFPAVNALAYNRAPRGSEGSVIALLTGMMDVGTMAGAFLLGLLAEFTGYPYVFPAAASAGLFASMLLVISILKRPEVIQEIKG